MRTIWKRRLEGLSFSLRWVGLVGLIIFMVVASIWMVLADGGGDLDYDFELEREEVLVTILKDGSVDIDYTFDFVNHGEIDGVDVGLPNRHYDEDSAWAYVQVGETRYRPDEIRKSPYVDEGLAVEFTDECRRAIENGGSEFSVRFHVNNPHMVYKNEIVDGTVGIRFRPTWFSSDFQRGDTRELVVRVVLPEGHVDANETYPLKGRPWDSAYVTTEGRMLLTWTFQDAPPERVADGRYDVGVGFPARHVKERYEHDFGEKVGDFGHSLGGFCVSFWPFILVAVFFVMFMFSDTIASRVRKEAYFEPELCVAEAGPRRDLTAVEAAVVMGMPMERVATMILFGLETKGLVRIDYESVPLRIEKVSEVGEHRYETRYLSAITSEGEVSRRVLKKVLVKLVEDVEAKLEGFGLEPTRTYYRAVTIKAWDQVRAAGTPEEFAGSLKENNSWLMLDEEYETRVVALHVPHGPTPGGSKVDARGMAQNFVDNLRSSSKNLVDDMRSLTSDVTSVTNPPITSGGGGGGGGGGCACACACACAGGGR